MSGLRESSGGLPLLYHTHESQSGKRLRETSVPAAGDVDEFVAGLRAEQPASGSIALLNHDYAG